MAGAPWMVSDVLWAEIEPLLPQRARRFRYPGRKRLPDREALQGILYVLHSGVGWEHLPPELGFGSGWTCWRRMDEWQRAGVWDRLHALLLGRLRAADQLDWSRAVIDGSLPHPASAPTRRCPPEARPSAARAGGGCAPPSEGASGTGTPRRDGEADWRCTSWRSPG